MEKSKMKWKSKITQKEFEVFDAVNVPTKEHMIAVKLSEGNYAHLPYDEFVSRFEKVSNDSNV